MPPELLATTTPTVAMSVDAGAGAGRWGGGGGGPMAGRGEVPVREPEHRARPDLGSAAAVEHLDAGEVAAHVEQDPVGLALAVEARAAAPEREVLAGPAREGDHLRDVVGVARHDDRLREPPVRARVRRVADQVARAREHAVGAEELDELGAQRLRR